MDINLPMDPPVNNSLQGNLYDKLDAVAFEKTRVMNCQLDTRRYIQEKILNKYRQDVERIHANQTKRLRREFMKIREKKPDYVYDDSDLAMSRSRGHENSLRQRSQSESSVAHKGGHCRRYYAHHYHVRYRKDEDKNKDEKNNKREKTDFFNLKLKLFFYNTMKNIYETQKRMKESNETPGPESRTVDTTPDIAQTKEPHNDILEHSDEVFNSSRHTETDVDDSDHSPDYLQRSHNSFFGNRMAKIEENTFGEGKPKRGRRRENRMLKMYGSDTVLNHINKKRESLDEKAFAKKREEWLLTRRSSDKVFEALT